MLVTRVNLLPVYNCSNWHSQTIIDQMKWSSLFLLLLIGLLAVSIFMLIFEEQYIYFPDCDIAATPDAAGLSYREVRITTGDGVELYGWYMPASAGAKTLLHFHGNAGNISHRLHLYRQWHRLGLSVLAIDYRGYGKSSSAISESGLYLDAEAAWQYLVTELKIPPDNIIIAGRSMGAAVASKLAIGKKAAGLVLETPFTDIRGMAAEHYPWLPVRALIRTRLNTLAHIQKVDLPLLIIAAADDEIVPLSMPRRIHASSREPKQFIQLPGGHNDFDIHSETAYRTAWQNWLQKLEAVH